MRTYAETIQLPLAPEFGPPAWQVHWRPSHRADPRALALYLRHYSAAKGLPYRKTTNQFVAPGECLVLLTPPADALWVWHKSRPGMRLDKQEGVSCAVFRNEGAVRASELVLEAERWAWQRWPGARLFTYVDADQVRSEVPGYCFRRARWKSAGHSQRGLLLLAKSPPTAPPAGSR